MQKILLSLVACNIFLISCGQDPASAPSTYVPVEKRINYSLGERKIELVVQQFGERQDIVMLNLHDDETTSVEAARRVLAETGGVLFRIENDEARLISFEQDGRSWRFDPNRMFSAAGIKATLTKFNNTFNEAAVATVTGFASFLLDQLPSGTRTLIALHNNDEGNLSVDSYRPGGPYAKDVEKVHKSAISDADNFFLTTDKDLFGRISLRGFNIVLQENRLAADDGSLSIYYGRNSRSYVNVEVQQGQVEEQEKMIRELITVLEKQVNN